MLANLRQSRLTALSIASVFALSLLGATPLPAEERYPAVARLSLVSGEVTLSRGDDPDEWDDALENVPLTVGDRIYAPENSRAEVQLSSGNFVRLAPRSFLSTLNLSDDIKQFYLGEGAASFHIRRLSSDEVFEIDTPNVSVTFEEPGRYRVAVDENGDSRITVRRGRASIAANGKQIAVENSEIRVYGSDSVSYEIVGLPATDAFDRWVTERDDRFERNYADASRYASEDIIGAEDLAQYGRWEQIPEYGYAWTPAVVAAGWAPFTNGHWYWQDPWGWNWISNERWGWATSHYGRWTPYRSRWYWVPVRPRTRVRYAPACVEFVRVRDHVGWFPLHPRDRHVPWWERRDRRFDRNVTYFNRNHVTIVNHNTFITARPVHRHIVRDRVILRDAHAARFAEALPVPNRSSLRIVSNETRSRGHKPGDHILNRIAVVRTAPPPPPRPFQEKLPEIQKNQGKAIEPARILAATQDDRGSRRLRVRPAAETNRGDFAPRNPSANAGPALQPVTAARGKKLATRDTADNAQQNTPVPQRAGREQDREREQGTQSAGRELEQQKQAQRDEERKAQLQKQQQERERQAQEQKQRDLERRETQQKDDELKGRAQKQPAQQPQGRSREQLRLEELERQQREQERKAQAQQNRQEQERSQQLKQQQERQAQQQRQQDRQQEERKAQALLQQEQARREQQLRQQQQSLERQAREQQRQQQEIERRQFEQREQERNLQSQQRQEQAREQQLRQQQMQAQREAQQIQRQQEQQERRVQPRRPLPPQEVPGPQPMPQVPR